MYNFYIETHTGSLQFLDTVEAKSQIEAIEKAKNHEFIMLNDRLKNGNNIICIKKSELFQIKLLL